MGAASGDLQNLPLGLEPLPGEEPRERVREGLGGEFVHTPAILADQEGHEVARPMIVGAGHEGVLAREPMGEALFHEEIERPVDRHGGKAPAPAALLLPDPLQEIVGPERLVGGVERLEDLSADGGQTCSFGPAGSLGPGERLGGSLGLVRGMGAGARVRMVVIVAVVIVGHAASHSIGRAPGHHPGLSPSRACAAHIRPFSP